MSKPPYITIPMRGVGMTGTVTDTDPLSATFPPTAWTRSNNLSYRDGAIERSPHFRALGTLAEGTPSFVVGHTTQAGQSEIIIGHEDGTVARWATRGRYGEPGIETDLTPDDYVPSRLVNPAMTSTSDQDVVYLNRADRPLWSMNKTGPGFELAPGWHQEWRCKAVRSLGDQIIAIGFFRDGRYYPAGVKFSDFAVFGSPALDWEAKTTNSAGENILGNLAERLIDGCALRGRMMLYAQRAMIAMTPRPDNFVFDFQPVFSNNGVISQNCVVDVDNIHYVFGPDSIWAHDGTSVLWTTGGRLTNDIYTYLVRAASYRFFTYFDPVRKIVMFAHVSTHPDCKFKIGKGNVPNDLDPYPGCNRAAVYDLRAETWGFADLPYIVGAAHVQASTGKRWDEFGTTTWADLRAAGTTFDDLLDKTPPVNLMISPVRTILSPPPPVVVPPRTPIIANDDTFTFSSNIPPIEPPIDPPASEFVAARTVQMKFFNNENGHVNTNDPPMVGNLLVAVMTRAAVGYFGNDPVGPNAKDPLPGWTVLAKSQPHDRVATTLVYRYVDEAFHEQVRTSSTVHIFEDAPWTAATTLVFWEFDAAPTIEDAIPAFSVEVLDPSTFSAKTFGSNLTSARIVSATTVRPSTSTITVSGGDYTVTGTETNDFLNRNFRVVEGTTPGGPTITITGAGQLSHVALAVRKNA